MGCNQFSPFYDAIVQLMVSVWQKTILRIAGLNIQDYGLTAKVYLLSTFLDWYAIHSFKIFLIIQKYASLIFVTALFSTDD